MGNTRGSEWRRWDLHVHTPLSIENNYGCANDEEGWNKYITALEQLPSDIKVLGINDYLFIDGYKKVKEYKDSGRLSNIELLLPVVEFRLAKFCGHKQFKRINFHIIFSNEVTPDVIQHQFLNALNSHYTLSSDCTQQWGGVVTMENLEILGRCIISSVPEEEKHNYGSPLKEGFNNLNLELSQIMTILKNAPQYFKGKYLTAIGKTEWDEFKWDDSSIAEKKTIINQANIVFTAAENIEMFNKAKAKLKEQNVNSLLLDCSDAHSFADASTKDRLGNCNTWIKADPTFEGLKQILFEPEERVRIQKENPKYDFEKSPFTEISIKNEVKLFSKDEQGNVYNDDDNISFSETTIPLNENLVSIIGGRGTGKSRLIDYISVNLGKESKLKSEYTKSKDIIVKRATSLKENEKDFSLDESNSIPFMYISQSEIKDIVENNGKFTAKIREIIGISSDYSADEKNIKEATQLLNEYSNLAISLFAGGTTSDQKKAEFEEQIKRYENFISNVTSENNKEKLTKYKESLETLNNYKKNQITTEELITNIKNSQDELNSKINSLNNQICEIIPNVQIPQVDNQAIIKYIDTSVINVIRHKIEELQKNIDRTKNKFPDYKGDLASLLDNIQKYQNQVNELKTKIRRIDEEETQMRELISIKLKQLGEEIKKDVFRYKADIETKWNTFISGKESYSDKQIELLKNVLGTESIGKENEKDKIELSVNIDFDENKFYAILTEKLDKRTWKKEYLKTQLGINNFDDFISFITQPFKVDSFENNVSVINTILECIYLKYTDYISHRIEIIVNNKSLKKLSVGQKGTIYLRLQLAANLFSETIIYDQPEDDLDNKFINESLVNLFKSIKKYRQVIIVSHNANLVVNADSEQIIVAENNNGVLSYHSGAMENKEINKKICEILEGGQEAFEKREKKYGLR